MFIFIAYNYDA